MNNLKKYTEQMCSKEGTENALFECCNDFVEYVITLPTPELLNEIEGEYEMKTNKELFEMFKKQIK